MTTDDMVNYLKFKNYYNIFNYRFAKDMILINNKKDIPERDYRDMSLDEAISYLKGLAESKPSGIDSRMTDATERIYDRLRR